MILVCITALTNQVFERFSSSQNLELQQRACEYLGLSDTGEDIVEEVACAACSCIHVFTCLTNATFHWRWHSLHATYSRSSSSSSCFKVHDMSLSLQTVLYFIPIADICALLYSFTTWVPNFLCGVFCFVIHFEKFFLQKCFSRHS